jgi:hypothetical protein
MRILIAPLASCGSFLFSIAWMSALIWSIIQIAGILV